MPIIPQPDVWSKTNKSTTVYGIPKNIFVRIPPVALFHLYRVREEVDALPVAEWAERWKKLTETFTVCPRSSPRPRPFRNPGC